MEPTDAKTQILSDVAPSILRDIANIVGRAYTRASENALSRFSKEVAHDYAPMERRAIIENALAMLGSRFPQLQVACLPNKKGTSYFHRLSLNKSVLTVSKTQDPGELTRDADFRRTLARDPQLVFAEYRDLVPGAVIDPEADGYYGIVAHGTADNDPSSAGYIEILIPDSTGNRVLDRVDLFPLWDAGAKAAFPTEPISPVEPRLRNVPRRAEDAGA